MKIFGKGMSEAHKQLQEWRAKNQSGFIIKLNSLKSGVLHNTICKHLGNTDWEENQMNWGSMGNTFKYCFDSQKEIQKWMIDHSVFELKNCKSCKPLL